MKYLFVIERTATGYSAYSPDLPGCIATSSTRDEVEREMKGAIAFHLDGLKDEGMTIPQPSSPLREWLTGFSEAAITFRMKSFGDGS
jgi:predicted RNase H-like HicB family nuclease